MRIVSLLPSATEMVCAVGALDELVGVSHECDYPADVRGLPVLTRPRCALPQASGQIDRAIRRVLEDALAVYEIDTELLGSLEPDVVVTQDLCDVCAVSIGEVRSALAELADSRVQLVSLRPTRLADVWGDVVRVGQALGREVQGREAAAGLQGRLDSLRQRTSALDATPTVLTVEWLDPVMIGGTWMPELAIAAGGAPLVTEPGQHAPTLSRAELATLDPDVVLIKPCGFDLARSAEELELLGAMLPWDRWKAVRDGRVFLADGNAFFNRPGPRLVESAEILAACLHPQALADLAQLHTGSFRSVTQDLELVAPLA